MREWIRKQMIAAVAVLCFLGLAGCSAGSTVNTELKVNKDLSGVRVMDVAIDGAVFSENFNGDINALNAVVEQKCPGELAWSYDNSDGTDRYHVELVILVILSLLGGAVGMGIDEGLEAAALLLFLFFALILVNGIMAAFLGYLFWKISIPIYIYLLTIVRTICDMLGNKSLNIYNSLLNRIMRRIQRI